MAECFEDYFLTYVHERGMKFPLPKKGSKFAEEADEFLEALKDLNRAIAAEKPKAIVAAREHLMEEAADVIFALSALARQQGFTLEEALALKITKDRGRNGVLEERHEDWAWLVLKKGAHVATFWTEAEARAFVAQEKKPEKFTVRLEHVSSGLF